MNKSTSKPPSGTSIRTFVAVEIPPDQKRVLAQVIEGFAAERQVLKLVTPDLLHITIRFLGPVANARLPSVEEAARQAVSQTDAFQLALSGIGAFPNARAPRVLWAGIRPGVGLDHLGRLAVHLEESLRSRGFPPESRAFSPHITLARTRNDITHSDRRRIADTLNRAQTLDISTPLFDVRELVVMSSDPGPSGPRYTPLLTVPFGVAM